MPSHRYPERPGKQRPTPGPVDPETSPIDRPAPVDTDDTTLIEAVRPPVPGGPTPTLAAVEPPAPSGGKRPEPVLSAARVAGVVSAVILGIGGVLKLVGVLVPRDYDLQPLADQAASAVLAIAGAWALFGPWITARIRARDLVTPLSDPRDAHGRRLTPEEP